MSDPAKYRSREEVQKIRDEKDPIDDIKSLLIDNRIYSDKEVKKIDTNIRETISIAADKALSSPFPSIDNLYEDVLVMG